MKIERRAGGPLDHLAIVDAEGAVLGWVPDLDRVDAVPEFGDDALLVLQARALGIARGVAAREADGHALQQLDRLARELGVKPHDDGQAMTSSETDAVCVGRLASLRFVVEQRSRLRMGGTGNTAAEAAQARLGLRSGGDPIRLPSQLSEGIPHIEQAVRVRPWERTRWNG